MNGIQLLYADTVPIVLLALAAVSDQTRCRGRCSGRFRFR